MKTLTKISKINDSRIFDEVCKLSKDSKGAGDFLRVGRDVYIYVAYITPEIAQELIECQITNRNLKRPNIERFASDMREGRWILNGATVIIDSNMQMLDGQHRMHACVESGEGFTTLVVEGVDKDGAITIDSGTGRTLGDQLKMFEYAAPPALAALSNLISMYIDGVILHKGNITGPGRSHRSRQELLELINRYDPYISECVRLGTHHGSLLSGKVKGFMYFMCPDEWSELDEFFQTLNSGLNLTKTDPIYHLRRMLEKNKSKTGNYRLTPNQMLAFTIKAWELWKNGEPVRQLKVDMRANFPQFTGPLPEGIEYVDQSGRHKAAVRARKNKAQAKRARMRRAQNVDED